MIKDPSKGRLIAALAGAILMLSGTGTPAQEADPDWPCVQRLLPEIAGGMIWAGPPLDEVEVPRDDRPLMTLAGELAARRVPIEDAESQLAAFAAGLSADDRTNRLAALFKATLEIINHDRASIINGIRKFSRGQRTLADRITAKNEDIQTDAADDILKRDALMAERDWDIRIFEDRRQSLTYLCEQPVLLEQRAFTLARAIAGALERSP